MDSLKSSALALLFLLPLSNDWINSLEGLKSSKSSGFQMGKNRGIFFTGENEEIYYVACHIIFDAIIINMDSSTEKVSLVGRAKFSWEPSLCISEP